MVLIVHNPIKMLIGTYKLGIMLPIYTGKFWPEERTVEFYS